MTGGNGGDTYVVDNVGDVVNETGTGGRDDIGTYISYSIENNLNIEDIYIYGNAGVEITGNSLANVLVGSDLDGDLGNTDVLRGLGGNDIIAFHENGGGDIAYGDAGNDSFILEYSNATMYGGTGNDTWDLWYSGGQIIEYANEGIDTVNTNGSYTLGANLENLYIDPQDPDSDPSLTGTGNALNNHIEVIGHYVTLNGLGGDDILISDADITTTLSGGAGADQLHVDIEFEVDDPYTPLEVTTLLDFEHGIDTIVLHSESNIGIQDGDLAARRFHAGTAATTAAHRIIYDISTGNLYYDSDGNGAAAQLLFGNLGGTSQDVDHTDFVVA